MFEFTLIVFSMAFGASLVLASFTVLHLYDVWVEEHRDLDLLREHEQNRDRVARINAKLVRHIPKPCPLHGLDCPVQAKYDSVK